MSLRSKNQNCRVYAIQCVLYLKHTCNHCISARWLIWLLEKHVFWQEIENIGTMTFQIRNFCSFLVAKRLYFTTPLTHMSSFANNKNYHLTWEYLLHKNRGPVFFRDKYSIRLTVKQKICVVVVWWGQSGRISLRFCFRSTPLIL